MAKMKIVAMLQVDASELHGLVKYLREVAAAWPNERRDALEDELLALIDQGDFAAIHFESGQLHASLKPEVFALLARYGIGSVLPV